MRKNTKEAPPPAASISAAAADRRPGVDTYTAPPPPTRGRIIGLDCHPDTFTAAVFRGTTPHDACQLSVHPDMNLEALLQWAAAEFSGEDLFLLEAGSNSFEICRRLQALGRRAVVMESAHVGKHAKTYADNDQMAAARIARVYLQGQAPCVWVPEERTCQRRELLHAYQSAVGAHIAAVNSLRSYLCQFTVRPGSRPLAAARTETWILNQRDWTPLQRHLLGDYFSHLRAQDARRQDLRRLIGREICAEPLMLRCMRVLGIGPVNAFALLAVIGEVGRFERPEKLVAYLGLNPGQRESRKGKRVKLGVGRRGRGDVRHLLIQAAQAVLRTGRATPLGQWGWRLFARKGNRNTAVAAVARKLAVQVWHALSGHPPVALERSPSFDLKLRKLLVTLGKTLRQHLALPTSLQDCVLHLKSLLPAEQPHPAST